MNLNQVTIPSINLEKATIFYQKLGLQLIVDARPKYVRFECPEGDATFSIHLVERLPTGEGVSVYFELDNLDKKVEELIAQGIELLEMPEDRTWLWQEARLLDPDGNKVILFFAGDNRKNPPWRVK
ncbi:MAG: catechol 2,3-dioxygenase-like lactoylglutathione lyase family enzyme [Paraglaciecola sp.]|jgi:catechol 2,3-dioxygenase-like lactoylglutathione lyase family enzyme